MRVRWMGQLGNQFFQYVVGCILAQKTKQQYCPPAHWKTKRGAPVQWSQRPYVLPKLQLGTLASGSEQRVCTEHWIDLDQFDPSRPINIDGYFQRYELFRDWKQQIRNDWLRIETPFIETDPSAVYIHCRRTDYVPGVENPNDPSRHGIALTVQEYAEALRHFSDARRLVVCTDDMRDPFLAQFARFGLPCTITGDPWDKDFLTLLSCRQLLMCQSTFSWWAGFLGRAERIVCPISPGTLWSFGVDKYGPPQPGQRDWVNLYPDDEPHRWAWLIL